MTSDECAPIELGGGEVLLVKEACELLRCGKTKVYDLFEAGELEGYRLGAGVRIYKESVTRFKASHANRLVSAPMVRPTAPPANRRKKKPAPLRPPLIGGYGHGL